MTQKADEGTIMNDTEENRKIISLKAIKNENEFSNNNETSKCKQTEFEQSENKSSRIIDNFVKDISTHADKDKSENCDFENSKDSESISTIDKGKLKKCFIYDTTKAVNNLCYKNRLFYLFFHNFRFR